VASGDETRAAADDAGLCSEGCDVSFANLSRPRVRPLEPWQRNQYVVVVAVALAFCAFELTQPFVPLYIRELGVSDLSEAAFWSGIVAGVAPLCAAVMGPFWGSLADRYGRKPMVLRALVFIGVLQIASAFAPNVYWLLATRVLMGLSAGFTSMAMALAIAVSPRDRMASAIGLVQAAQIAPAAVGPLIGGVLSDWIGLRASFITTGMLLIVPVILLSMLVQESFEPVSRSRASEKSGRAGQSAWALLLIPGFAVALAILFTARFTERALQPILPLFLVELQTPTALLATITGLVVAAGALAATCSSVVYGRRARPDNTRTLLMIALFGGAVVSVLLIFSSDWVHVVVLRVLLGLLAGGTISLAYTMGARLAPAERSGLTLSVLASCGMLGGATAPILAGVLSQVNLRAVFLATAVAYLVALLLAAGPLLRRTRSVAPEPATEAEVEAET
jgi:DHA1 family multidrug resistance protein-like MFS transporter